MGHERRPRGNPPKAANARNATQKPAPGTAPLFLPEQALPELSQMPLPKFSLHVKGPAAPAATAHPSPAQSLACNGQSSSVHPEDEDEVWAKAFKDLRSLHPERKA